MESELSPDKEKSVPPVPIRTYQWEDIKRAREAGFYPWTHLLKVPLEGEITAEDIIRESTPRRSMSREATRSRTHSPAEPGGQRILILDSSPGSSRKHGEEGEDEGVHIPNFSKEISLDLEEERGDRAASEVKRPESQSSAHLVTPIEIPKNISPKGILKRRTPDPQYIGATETREKTKCCHPLVNKIKHLADKTLHKLEKNDSEKSPLSKRKKNASSQEIRQLKSSPGAVRRQKFSAIKLGDSDEMSKTMSIDTPPTKKKKDHIYEDIEEVKSHEEIEKTLKFTSVIDNLTSLSKDSENYADKKSNASHDPSLVAEETSLKSEDHVMEKLHKMNNTNKSILFDDELDADEPNVDEIFQNQFDNTDQIEESPNITITEITDEDGEVHGDQPVATPIELSPSPSPLGKRSDAAGAWSKTSSDHEYEIIEKPPPNTIYTTPCLDDKPTQYNKTDDELSSTTSLERKYLQHTSDEEEQLDDKQNLHVDKNEDMMNAETLQKNIEERFFVNTPSSTSRTECEVSTSQVDSSALEQLPLKRDSRTKNQDVVDSKIQQRIKEGTGKLKSQAEKLRTKLQNIKMPDRPKINMPEGPLFKMPQKPKISLPSRPKFTLPDRRKFSLPDRPKFKSYNFTEKLHRAKFTLPDKPKFSKFKMPEKPNFNFPSLGRKKENKTETDVTGSTSELRNVASVEFEARTYPRWLSRKKKTEAPTTSSSPNLNREDTPEPTFTFTRFKQSKQEPTPYIPDSPEQPREYGSIDADEIESGLKHVRQYERTYDFDNINPEYTDDDRDGLMENHQDTIFAPNVSPSNQEHTPVITEINNDEFFVRPRGISREDIQVRKYLSDETRHAFQVPNKVIALMGSSSEINDDHFYLNDPEADPELVDENEPIKYSTEDLNDKDDGYYTFPPVRPSRAKRKKKQQIEDSTPYIDDNIEENLQFSDVDLGSTDLGRLGRQTSGLSESPTDAGVEENGQLFSHNELHSIHEYANDDVIQYPESVPVMSQTLPMPPQRKRKGSKRNLRHSVSDISNMPPTQMWEESQHQEDTDDIIVYRTEHEFIEPEETTVTERSPVAPRRTRSHSSRATSLCDDDRTSRGAESLTLDTNIPPVDYDNREIRHESPGYATVDKTPYTPSKPERRSISKTPPARRRKSNSSERKYYTVGSKRTTPDRPPRKKSSASLMTLDSFAKRSVSGDFTQYVEIDELFEHKDLNSGEVVSKMKDRPLPPPPRPPRGSKRRKKNKPSFEGQTSPESDTVMQITDASAYLNDQPNTEDVVEIEVSTQTDPLPDDVDFELGIDENLQVSMSSSLRDIIEDESILCNNHRRMTESPRVSRPTSRTDKSIIKLSDPKICELSKPHIGRTSPTVILVERRVSSPTRINDRQELLTEASLTVQHIDIDESQIPDVPPLPRSHGASNTIQSSINKPPSNDERALEKVSNASREVQIDNLVTQRLQVRDLDVGRLNVSELQANKILVSDIEGMTLQVTELDSKSGHISVSGIEFSQSVIDEIVKKFAEISTSATLPPPAQIQVKEVGKESKPVVSCEEETQTDEVQEPVIQVAAIETQATIAPLPPARPAEVEEGVTPPRPPPPDLTPLLYSYLQDITIPPATYHPQRSGRERPIVEFHDPQSPPAPARRNKRKPAAPHSESSSDEARPRPSPRRMAPPVRFHEPTIAEAGAQFLRVCQSSISRTIRNIFNTFMSYISGTEDKRDVQMALVIFLVLIAGLIMFGLSDSRTIHHHHWEFFNPPDGKQ